MKSKDKKELHAKSIKELKNLIVKTRDELAVLKLDKTQNKLKNTSSLTNKRREIAQTLTVLRVKELVEVKAKK